MGSKKTNDIKKIQYSIKEMNLDERCDFLDHIWSNIKEEKFSLFVWILRNATDLSDDQVNVLSSEDIVELAKQVADEINKKK